LANHDNSPTRIHPFFDISNKQTRQAQPEQPWLRLGAECFLPENSRLDFFFVPEGLRRVFAALNAELHRIFDGFAGNMQQMFLFPQCRRYQWDRDAGAFELLAVRRGVRGS
jgi:hypothetical protein